MLLPTENIRLEPHPTARNQAIASLHITASSIIISIPSLTTVLLSSQKGLRCDTCFRISSAQFPLHKCTGCASYWYCNNQCQSIQWKAHHKKLCKIYNSYASSDPYQSLALHEKLDALLLAHLLVQIILSPLPDDESSPITVFRSLLPGPDPNGFSPPLPRPALGAPISGDSVNRLYSRFGNNNFAIHSHLNTVGHGIFPLASRLFNHSCVPNAVARYRFSPASSVTMEVVALRDILPDEEICLPYLDPALIQTRQQMFELTYGFRCRCSSCDLMAALGEIPPPPTNSHELDLVGRMLRDYVDVDQRLDTGSPSKPRRHIPQSMLCVLHETYLSTISETFSKASHEGNYDLALDTGTTILALYTVLYPPNYPQTGMHLLELAKTMWNMLVSSVDINKSRELAIKQQAQTFLSLGHKVLSVFGPEGDEEGPLKEAETLQSLLDY